MNTRTKTFGIYTLSYIGISIIYALINAFVFEMSAGGLIAVFLAALIAGQYFARFEDRVPSSAESWGYSAGFMVCVIVVSAIQLMAFPLPREVTSVLQSNAFVVVIAIFAVIAFLSCRFFFPFGAKNALKAKEKRDAKG